MNEMRPYRGKNGVEIYEGSFDETTYTDEAVICPACGYKESLNDLINDKGFPADGTDAQKIDWECSRCHEKLRVTMMIALWRTAVEAIDKSKSMSNPIPKSLDFTGNDV